MHAHVTCISCFSFSEDTDIRKNWKKNLFKWRRCTHNLKILLHCKIRSVKRILIHVDVCVTGQFSISFFSLSPNSWIIRDRRQQELCSARCDVHLIRGCTLGDPRADSGCEGKSKRAEKYGMKKSKDSGKSPWGQCLTRPVPNGCRRPGFWLVPENFCVFLPNQKPEGGGTLLSRNTVG